MAPPRPAKSSLDLRRRTESESENIRGDIKYLNLHFPSSVIRREEEDSDHNDNIVKDKEEEVIVDIDEEDNKVTTVEDSIE